MRPSLRALTPGDAEQVQGLAARAFDDLDVRLRREPRTRSRAAMAAWVRVQEHLLADDRSLGAFEDGVLRAAAVCYVRGRTWVLALLVVDPGRQSAGAGSSLLRAVLAEAPPERLLHASQDARAVRTYARAGFRLLPALRATGRPAVQADGLVRSADLAREVPAGCAHLAVDLEHLRAGGRPVLALADGRPGLAVVQGPPGHPRAIVLEAADAGAAQDLLRGALAAAAEEGVDVEVGPLVPQEDWAVEVLLDAGLEIVPSGPVCVAGLPAPLAGLHPPPAVYV